MWEEEGENMMVHKSIQNDWEREKVEQSGTQALIQS
jgi:hypothetical protein